MNLRMALLFAEALALLIAVMKLIALPFPSAYRGPSSVMVWLLPSSSSLARALPATNSWRVCRQALLMLGAVAASYAIYWMLVSQFHLRGIWLGYLACPILLFWGELLYATLAMLFLPTGRIFPPLHQHPLAMHSVADFWGRRWNLWFSDWFRRVIFTPLRGKPVAALIVVFAVSGLMHEWALNVPLYYLTGHAPFGFMLIYFLLQAAAILVERQLFKRQGNLQMLFAWLVVVAPVPLLLNEGLLRTLQLWPDP